MVMYYNKSVFSSDELQVDQITQILGHRREKQGSKCYNSLGLQMRRLQTSLRPAGAVRIEIKKF